MRKKILVPNDYSSIGNSPFLGIELPQALAEMNEIEKKELDRLWIKGLAKADETIKSKMPTAIRQLIKRLSVPNGYSSIGNSPFLGIELREPWL
ncbi:hypothetical protein [Cyclobacterium plantarum]|uniref:Uncharacterized protein n=1 Tax=Cyclobacterium plantarum TaxID=2716263 RepID=A0ABX0HDR9_9BACT|nr:hypothetical protein [Cyclobacterium plantarum]NHE58652.1 hypothetical protein [Cyclobacterium plantarum]